VQVSAFTETEVTVRESFASRNPSFLACCLAQQLGEGPRLTLKAAGLALTRNQAPDGPWCHAGVTASWL
jgi:hypothetical protein